MVSTTLPVSSVTRKSAELLLEPSEARDRLTEGAYINNDPNDVTGCIEYALECTVAAAEAARKLKKSREQRPFDADYATWMKQLVDKGVIDQDEAGLLEKAEKKNAIKKPA